MRQIRCLIFDWSGTLVDDLARCAPRPFLTGGDDSAKLSIAKLDLICEYLGERQERLIHG